MIKHGPLIAVIPAAGVGSRMLADCPKQYLKVAGKTILEHSVARLSEHPEVVAVVIAVSSGDPYIQQLTWSGEKPVHFVTGGAERADSVLQAVNFAKKQLNAQWVLVHDAARPCLRAGDLAKLINLVCDSAEQQGGILATPVRDTMKRAIGGVIDHTVERACLWHAQTPQLFLADKLAETLTKALAAGAVITDEASAMEWAGHTPMIVEGHADNLKITHPEDLALARFYLEQEAT